MRISPRLIILAFCFPYLEKENKQTHEIYYEFSCSLKAVGQNRLGIELDKTVRGRIKTVGLTPEVIQYAAGDVEHLEDIKNSQQIGNRRSVP